MNSVPPSGDRRFLFPDQGFIAQVDQHRVVLVVEPETEDFETAVFRPSCRIPVPTIELLSENLLA